MVSAANAQYKTDGQLSYQPARTPTIVSRRCLMIYIYREKMFWNFAESRTQECPPFCCFSSAVLHRKLYSNPCNSRRSSIRSNGPRVRVNHGNAVCQGPCSIESKCTGSQGERQNWSGLFTTRTSCRYIPLCHVGFGT